MKHIRLIGLMMMFILLGSAVVSAADASYADGVLKDGGLDYKKSSNPYTYKGQNYYTYTSPSGDSYIYSGGSWIPVKYVSPKTGLPYLEQTQPQSPQTAPKANPSAVGAPATPESQQQAGAPSQGAQQTADPCEKQECCPPKKECPTGSKCFEGKCYTPNKYEAAQNKARRADLKNNDISMSIKGGGETIEVCGYTPKNSEKNCVELTGCDSGKQGDCELTQDQINQLCKNRPPPQKGKEITTTDECEAALQASLDTEVGEKKAYLNDLKDFRLSFAQSVRVGQNIFQLLEGWDSFDRLFDWMDGMNDMFAETWWGKTLTGQWEDSICRVTTDYDSMASSGVLVTPGGEVAVWITGEVTKISHPSEDNPDTEVTDNYYKIELVVRPSGLVSETDLEDPDCKVKFYITLDGGLVDVNLDGTADEILIACEGSYAVTGANSLLIVSSAHYKEACIKFTERDYLKEDVKSILDNGNSVCTDIVATGTGDDLGDCAYCPGGGSGLPGFDFELGDIDLGLGGEKEEEEEESDVVPYTPKPGEAAPGGNAGVV